MDTIFYSMHLNDTRGNLASNPDRSPLMREPRSKTYGDHWLTAQSGVKARLRRHASAYQEVATPDPDCAVSPEGRALKHASAALHPWPRAATIGFGLRLAATCFRTRRDPIGLAPRLLKLWLCIGGRSSSLVRQISPDVRSLHAIYRLAIRHE
jgi:hypothetical protein